MKIHTLKFKGKKLCDAVYSGEKTHEIRLNDRDYKQGDLIEPIALDDDLMPLVHPINNVTYQIGFVTYEWPGLLRQDYCIFSIKAIEDRNQPANR